MIQPRQGLYWNKYQFCLSFDLVEASCIRGLDRDKIGARLEWRKRLGIRYPGNPGSWLWANRHDIGADTERNLLAVCDYLNDRRNDCKIMISYDRVFVYSNDISVLEPLEHMAGVTHCRYSEAVPGPVMHGVMLRRSDYSYRTYLRCHKWQVSQIVNLRSFLQAQSQDVKVSPSMRHWFESQQTRSQDYYFFDHVSRDLLLMLDLICPRLIRKTLPIIVTDK